MPKVHRVLLDRVSGYADEAGAFMRRRRLTRRTFARVHYPGGTAVEHSLASEPGESLLDAAGELVEIAGAKTP
jgi:hypothetical protein